VRLLPGSERRWRYVLFPLVAGHVALPKLRLSSPWLAQETLDRLAQRSLPTSFFVLVGRAVIARWGLLRHGLRNMGMALEATEDEAATRSSHVCSLTSGAKKRPLTVDEMAGCGGLEGVVDRTLPSPAADLGHRDKLFTAKTQRIETPRSS
jgi:hypothetical protein